MRYFCDSREITEEEKDEIIKRNHELFDKGTPEALLDFHFIWCIKD